MSHIQYKNAAIKTIYDEFVEFGARSAFFLFRYDRQAYKAARSRNLPRGTIIWSSFKFRSTAPNLRLLYELFSSSYLFILSI